MIIKTLYDDFGNMATIEHDERPAYKGGRRVDNYRLCIYALYDGRYLYHVSCYDTEIEAIEKLSMFSCGTFKEREATS